MKESIIIFIFIAMTGCINSTQVNIQKYSYKDMFILKDNNISIHLGMNRTSINTLLGLPNEKNANRDIYKDSIVLTYNKKNIVKNIMIPFTDIQYRFKTYRGVNVNSTQDEIISKYGKDTSPKFEYGLAYWFDPKKEIVFKDETEIKKSADVTKDLLVLLMIAFRPNTNKIDYISLNCENIIELDFDSDKIAELNTSKEM